MLMAGLLLPGLLRGEGPGLRSTKAEGGARGPYRSAFVFACDFCRSWLVGDSGSLPVVQRHLHPALAARTLRRGAARLAAHAEDRVLDHEAVRLRHDDLGPAGRTAARFGGEGPYELPIGHEPKTTHLHRNCQERFRQARGGRASEAPTKGPPRRS